MKIFLRGYTVALIIIIQSCSLIERGECFDKQTICVHFMYTNILLS